MSKYCAKCGKELNDQVKFCPGCGTEVVSNKTVQADQPVNHVKKQKKSGKIALEAGLAVLLILCIAFIGVKSLIAPTYEKPIKLLEQGLNEPSYSKIKEALAPGALDELLSDYSWILDYIDEDQVDEYIQQAIKSEYEENDTAKIELKVLDKEKINVEDLELEYSLNSSDASKATAAYNLTVEVKVKGASSSIEEETMEVLVIKINGKWKLAYLPIN